MTIRLVTPEWPPHAGGIATWAWEAAHALHARGERVVVHARATPREPSPNAPFPVVWMPGRAWARWGPVWAAASVWPAARRGDRLVFANWEMAARLVGAPGMDRLPRAVVWHGSDLTRPPRPFGRDRVRDTCVNLAVSRYLASILGVPAEVLPAPVDVAPLAAPGDRVLVVARLVASKGVDDAIRFAARLGRPLRVVGDGPERPSLERLAAGLGVDAEFVGRVRRAEIPWDGAWACVSFPRAEADGSGAEGLGLVLIEAAARGIPTIGNRCGGVPEAASVVLTRPESDEVGVFLPRDELRSRVAAAHGRERLAEALVRALDPAFG